MIGHARLLIACLWAGSTWTVGYLVAPTLFATLHDRVLAGTIAGSMFRAESWLSLICAALFVALALAERRSPAFKAWLWLAGGMALCAAANLFVLQPEMAALRESAGAAGVMASEARSRFGMLHGVSMGVFLAQSLLAVGLVLKSGNFVIPAKAGIQ